MIQVISYPDTIQTIQTTDEHGDPISLQIVVAPCDNAIRKGRSNIWFALGDDELKEGARVLAGAARTAAVPIRRDLPEDHPLFGMRCVSKVPAGYHDIVMRPSDKKLCFFNGTEMIDPDNIS